MPLHAGSFTAKSGVYGLHLGVIWPEHIFGSVLLLTFAVIDRPKVESAAASLVKALSERASAAAVSKYSNILANAGPLAIGVAGPHRLIVEYNGSEVHVWPYSMLVVGAKDHPIIIRGRQWDIAWGATKERIPYKGIAPSFAGGHLVLPPRSEPQIFETAIVTESSLFPTMHGRLDALDVETGETISLIVGRITFSSITRAIRQPPGLATLERADADRLLEAIEIYRASIAAGRRAIFRADRIELSSPGRRLINSFLFFRFRDIYRKSDTFDFSPLLPYKPSDETKYRLETTDHYIGLSEQWVIDSQNDLYFTYILVYNYFELLAKPSSDAGLAQQLAKLRTTYGVEQVAKELLRSASPEDRALVAGMAKSESASASTSSTTPNDRAPSESTFPPEEPDDQLPEMSERDLQQLAAQTEARPWSSDVGKFPSEFISLIYKKWLGKKRLMREHISASGGEKLIAAYATEIHDHPERLVKNLGQRPHTRHGALPDHLPKAPSNRWIPTAELSDEERTNRRLSEAKRKREQRARNKPSRQKITSRRKSPLPS